LSATAHTRDDERATAVSTDGRREAGVRTRQRLIDATLDLLAEHGEGGVSLRAITEAAGANVAAVSYHFGSKDTLVRAAIEESLDRLVDEQTEGLRALADPTLEQIATAWTAPVVRAVAASPCQEQVFMRVVGRCVSGCSDERREQIGARSTDAEDELVAALARVVPDAGEAELRFRAAAVNSILNFVTTGAAGLDGKPAAEIERLLVPVVAGALGAPTR
jgi:AcrR family transcriptional regulator